MEDFSARGGSERIFARPGDSTSSSAATGTGSAGRDRQAARARRYGPIRHGAYGVLRDSGSGLPRRNSLYRGPPPGNVGDLDRRPCLCLGDGLAGHPSGPPRRTGRTGRGRGGRGGPDVRVHISARRSVGEGGVGRRVGRPAGDDLSRVPGSDSADRVDVRGPRGVLPGCGVGRILPRPQVDTGRIGRRVCDRWIRVGRRRQGRHRAGHVRDGAAACVSPPPRAGHEGDGVIGPVGATLRRRVGPCPGRGPFAGRRLRESWSPPRRRLDRAWPSDVVHR